MFHQPVLKNEVIEYLNPQPNEDFIDATFGEGGHTEAILEKNGPSGRVLGIECDKKLYEELRVRQFPARLIIVNDSYLNLKLIIQKYNFSRVKGVLFDLGLSSWHLEKSGRGFSFKKNELLDMRFDTSLMLTAREIVNTWSERELDEIFKKYGDERFSRNIAKKIVEKRKEQLINTTLELVHIIADAVPGRYLRKKPHFAARTFQALRITVNDELGNIKEALPQALEALGDRGRLVVISFHSGEDRVVKNFLKNEAKKGQLKILTKKPIRPSKEELELNRRARSSILRAGEKV
jgi:16S rRNA (cytosine1402-N4)-methyltransferase